MIHARPDYMRFQDPALDDPTLLGKGCTPIAEDEPVFLLRAKDKHFSEMLSVYASLVAGDERMVNVIFEHLERAYEWRKKHGCKTPDLAEDQP